MERLTSIKKDKRTGKYYFVYSGGFHPVTGKRIQKKRKGIHSLKEAKEELKRVIIEVEQEKNSYKADKSSFGNFAEKWFESKKVRLRSSTIVNYREQLDYNILPYLGTFKIKDITEEVLQHYINRLHNERKLAPATIRTAYGIVAEILKKASRKGAFDLAILDDINLPPENRVSKVWTEKNVQTFLDSRNRIVSLTRYFIGMVLSVITGMRMGEVLGLRWSDIDFEKGYLTIRQTLAKIDDEGNYGLVPEVKTAAGFRTVHLPKFFIEYLIEHKKMVQREKEILGEDYIDYDLVVCTKHGKWVHPNNYRRAFTRLIAQLELPKIPPKNLRHTHATYLISIGISPKIVQERLGHAHIKTTLGTYSHVLPSMQAELVGKLDDLVAKV
ncbi:site-specific integrase [Bacillus haynesii]|uniref:site-specific integrase n=1 Tax=Bacillus haynesii TaxID=1925021 RepID=UPI002DBD7AE6|nr:site-specific integrase [Bacillus haynesii]MEC1344886.1 site-specific integrase [Bacillus haynesii]